MNTITIEYENDTFEITYNKITIVRIRRNHAMIKFNQLPEEVQVELVTRMQDTLVNDLGNITQRDFYGKE